MRDWLDPMIGARERKAGAAASRAFDAYFRPIIEERRAEPRDDIVSTLVRAQDESVHLSERETLNMLRLLLSAGNETTVNLIETASWPCFGIPNSFNGSGKTRA